MITILLGKSASGKDTMLSHMEKEGAKRIVTCTTRPRRKGEKEGVEYNFISPELFKFWEKCKLFVETRSYNTLVEGKPDTWLYGSPELMNEEERDYATILDVSGTLSYIKHYGPEKIRVKYLVVPDVTRKERAKKRGSFDVTEWNRRARDDAEKFSDKNIAKIKALLGNHFETIDNSLGGVYGSELV